MLSRLFKSKPDSFLSPTTTASRSQEHINSLQNANDNTRTLLRYLEELKTLHETNGTINLIETCFTHILKTEFKTLAEKKPYSKNDFFKLSSAHLHLTNSNVAQEVLLQENGVKITGREKALADFNKAYLSVIDSLNKTIDERIECIRHGNQKIRSNGF